MMPFGALLQIISLMLLTFCSLCFIILVRPFVKESQNKLEIVNEVLMLVISYHLLLLTGAFPEPEELTYNVGWSFIFVMCFILAVNLSNLVAKNVQDFKKVRKAKKTKMK